MRFDFGTCLDRIRLTTTQMDLSTIVMSDEWDPGELPTND